MVTQSVVLSAKRDFNVSKLELSVSQVHAVLPMHAHLVRKICLEIKVHPLFPKKGAMEDQTIAWVRGMSPVEICVTPGST